MATLEQIQARVEDLTRRHTAASTKQSKLQGVMEEKKQELLRLKQEIEAAGFDPKTLREERARLEKELEELITKFDTELAVVERAQDEYEK
jgi:chromosome segregation ATPase